MNNRTPMLTNSSLTFVLVVARFIGNGLYDRLETMGMQPIRRPQFDFVKHVPWNQVIKYTMVQFGAVVLIFFVSFNFFMPEGSAPIAITFPIIIAILIPVRERWISTKFTVAELSHLDPT